MVVVATGMLNRARGIVASRWRAVIQDLPLLLQQTAAATTAWVIARQLLDHRDPFFAPISALVSLNMPLGERGLNAVRLLQGVVLGICVGEIALLTFGGGYGTLALATFLALVLGRAVGSARIVVAQSAVAAVLTVATARGEVGFERLTEALVGTGVAVVFSQALFSPDPLRLLRRHESDALRAMAAALELTAQALDGDTELAERAVRSQRELRDQLSEFARTRRTTNRAARHSLVWRSRIAPVVGESEDAGHLDLLGTSCLLLTRAVLGAHDGPQPALEPFIRTFSGILADLARQPGDRTTRQAAVERSLTMLHEMDDRAIDTRAEAEAARTAMRIAVIDLMLFVGVDHVEVLAATRPEVRDDPPVEVPPPRGPTPHTRLGDLHTRIVRFLRWPWRFATRRHRDPVPDD